MAMPQRDNTIEAIKRLDALLEYAVMHGGCEVQIETLPAGQQEPARKGWEKVLRPFERVCINQ